MDILTSKGQMSRRHEQEAMHLFATHQPAVTLLETPKDRPARLDGLIAEGDQLIGGYEVKCRYRLTHHDLMTKFKGEWLVTAEKLHECIAVCRALEIPFFGFLYLVDEKKLLIQRIWNPKTDRTVRIRTDRTATQKTINGGTIIRENAFIDMHTCKVCTTP